MKITKVETIRLDSLPNIAYVRIHTDEGLVGLGETFFGAGAVTAWLHETAAPYLLGKDPLQIERHWHGLNPFVGFNSSGVENRGRSAVDIALWDMLGQALESTDPSAARRRIPRLHPGLQHLRRLRVRPQRLRAGRAVNPELGRRADHATGPTRISRRF